MEFTRNPNFKYDEELETVLKTIEEETDELSDEVRMDINDAEYNPFNWFSRGNFFHQNSPEEKLIDG